MMLECKNIVKRFGDNYAINNLSFSLKERELMGIIGPDGAGKTTLMRTIVSTLAPDSGELYFEGRDIYKNTKYVRQHIGYSPGKFSLYQDLTVEENLILFSGIFGTTLEKSYHLIEPVYKMLEPFKNRPAGKLSGGMKQKLSLCCSLVHIPKLLVLDEPTTGVDAVSRKEFWELLHDLKDKGITTIVSTPYMDEASMCDRVLLIQDGKELVTNTPSAIEESFSMPLYGVRTEKIPQMLKALRSQSITHTAYPFGVDIHWAIAPSNRASGKTPNIDRLNIEELKQIVSPIDPQASISPIRAGIEDCFMDLMIKTEEDKRD